MFKTLQWNHSPVVRGSTWVLNILKSFLWSIRVQIMKKIVDFFEMTMMMKIANGNDYSLL